MLVFTSCTNNYIPKARVLVSSLKKWHPDWEFCLLLGEEPPKQFSLENEEFDRILYFNQLDIPNFKSWLFQHRVIEACTAAKGPALHHFLKTEKHNKVIYLDPDIMVINSLQPLVELLDKYDVLLTPHCLTPQPTYKAIYDNEISILKHGLYNLGFLAVAGRNEGFAFADWWKERLYHFCYDDIPSGIFTDQRWCDLVPLFFKNTHIIQDPGYNAASWNLTDRTITLDQNDTFWTNDSLLRFYHFTGYDSGSGKMAIAYYVHYMPAVNKLWDMYAAKLTDFKHSTFLKLIWNYSFFNNKIKITDHMRLIYRNNIELQTEYPDPFDTTFNDNYLNWYAQEFKNKTYLKKLKKIFKFLIKPNSIT